MLHHRAKKTEIIAFSSGKGGTGKTSLCASLAYALVRAKLKVLLIDADPGTDGLSLFVLGKDGMEQIAKVPDSCTFAGYLRTFQEHPNAEKAAEVEPLKINRASESDHGVLYEAIVSSRGVYGDDDRYIMQSAVPHLDRDTFIAAVRALFERLRAQAQYDYVLVDTRGGFSSQSTDVCALADSFVVVTEATYPSFYQDRNLIRRINQGAEYVGRDVTLRAIIVNKAIEGEEVAFRNMLTREFAIAYDDTFSVPFDAAAVRLYKTHRIPYLDAPGSGFANASLHAFAKMLSVVVARWSDEQIHAWNELVDLVKKAVDAKQKEEEARKRDEQILRRSAGVWQRFLKMTVAIMGFVIVVGGVAFGWFAKRSLIKIDALDDAYQQRLVAEQTARSTAEETSRLDRAAREHAEESLVAEQAARELAENLLVELGQKDLVTQIRLDAAVKEAKAAKTKATSAREAADVAATSAQYAQDEAVKAWAAQEAARMDAEAAWSSVDALRAQVAKLEEAASAQARALEQTQSALVAEQEANRSHADLRVKVDELKGKMQELNDKALEAEEALGQCEQLMNQDGQGAQSYPPKQPRSN